MTPKEKAKELVNRFIDFTKNENPPKPNNHYNAKQCALICVEEIDKAIDFDWMEMQNLDREHTYWNEVKQEIEKL